MNVQAIRNNIQVRQLAKRQQHWNKLLYMFSFLMAFPSILFFGQNVSILVFAAMVLFLVQNSRTSLLGFTKPLQCLALMFGVGAILSVANIPSDAASDAFDRAIMVLPNYLYWSLLIIILIQQRRLINLEVVYNGVFWGVICTLIYYLFFQQALRVLPIFNRQSPNNFAFVLICYTPIAVYYLKVRKNHTWALAFLILLILILLNEGRRAGMVLVLLGGIAVLYADRINWKRFLAGALAVPIFLITLYSTPVESFIWQSSERIHEMIYETEKIQKEDRSYLTRVAMVKKGLAIYEKYPYTGIGLNNFTNYETSFDKSFVGAQYVVHKKEIQKKSSHNSYIGVLAEGGLISFIPFIAILLTPLLFLLINFKAIQPEYRPVFYGLILMAVHLYFIMAIVNVFAWFLIGISCALVYRKV